MWVYNFQAAPPGWFIIRKNNWIKQKPVRANREMLLWLFCWLPLLVLSDQRIMLWNRGRPWLIISSKTYFKPVCVQYMFKPVGNVKPIYDCSVQRQSIDSCFPLHTFYCPINFQNDAPAKVLFWKQRWPMSFYFVLQFAGGLFRRLSIKQQK